MPQRGPLWGFTVVSEGGLRSPARTVRPELNAGLRGEVVGDGAVVAGHGGRGGVDLLDEQDQGAGDAGGAGLLEVDGDRGGGGGGGGGPAAAGVKVMVPARPRMMLWRVVARYSSSSRR